jgi:hypothetical protein
LTTAVDDDVEVGHAGQEGQEGQEVQRHAGHERVVVVAADVSVDERGEGTTTAALLEREHSRLKIEGCTPKIMTNQKKVVYSATIIDCRDGKVGPLLGPAITYS